jgi:hypothetical protein
MTNKRGSTGLSRAAAFGAILITTSAAWAQGTPKNLEPLPDIPPPPKLSNVPTPADEDEATSVTVRQDGDTKIEEFRTHGGRIYAVRVTPKVGKPYMMIDPDGKGGATNASEINGGVRPSQWTLFEF